ncbi:MAG TPA: HepT-like ribonuclease domain-containing protein [Pirellulales bacterium]|nr:HepT-like ribonuclease domain-containing protein [Pirellulales bacterium]
MLRAAEEATQLANGRTRSDLDSDRLLNLAITRLLEIVGEAAGRVTEATQLQYSDIPWPQIIAMRNRLIHGYDNVDFDILWDIVQLDLPPLIAKLHAILDPMSGFEGSIAP